MLLLNIHAENYRTLQNITITFSKDYCTISGKNNAGKSCVIRLLLALLQEDSSRYWMYDEALFDYKEDKTQWIKDDSSIKIGYKFQLNQKDDPALISFIEKISTKTLQQEINILEIEIVIEHSGNIKKIAKINNDTIDTQATNEIIKKLKTSNLLFHHNSTSHEETIYRLGRLGRRKSFYELMLSEDEQKKLTNAAKALQKTITKLAKEHKEGLNSLLGKLSDKYDVEFSTLQRNYGRDMPFAINLKDKNVEVPLDDWGSGTQNRTFIFISILQANRIKRKESTQDKITPIVIIEEPECFLHPSAQSEFGKIIKSLAVELGIQIIITTHSPYMLNREKSDANVLLCRKTKRNKALQTVLIKTDENDWMAPFAQHLGIEASEFNNWRPLFSSYQQKVLLVEGETDKEYFEFLRVNSIGSETLNKDIEIVPYGGKDALKNILLVKFVLSKFDNVFITFDLDCAKEIQKSLNGLGLRENNDFLPIGLNKPGKDRIEGLLPKDVLSSVMAEETDLAMQLTSQNTTDRNDAKRQLKIKCLEKFKSKINYTDEDVVEFIKVTKIINKKLKAT